MNCKYLKNKTCTIFTNTNDCWYENIDDCIECLWNRKEKEFRK